MNPTKYVIPQAAADFMTGDSPGAYIEGPLRFLHDDPSVLKLGPSPNNQWTVIPGENGEFLVQYSLPIAGPLEVVSPAINGSIAFYPNSDGGYDAVGVRDGFPWMEAYFHDGQGNVVDIFQDPAVRSNPHDLYAIEPGMGLGQTPGYAIGFSMYGPPQSSVLWPYSE